MDAIVIIWMIITLIMVVLAISIIIAASMHTKVKDVKFEYKYYDKNFEQIYSNILQNADSDKMGILKKKAKKEKAMFGVLSAMIMMIFLSIYIIPILFNLGGIIGRLYIICVMFALSICIFIAHSSKKSDEEMYTQEYKQKVILNIAKFFDNDVKYSPKQGMPQNIYNEGEFELYGRYTSDDYMEFTLEKNSHMIMAEVHTENRTKNGYYTRFRGLVTQTDMVKPFKEKFFIRVNEQIGIFTKPQAPKIKLDAPEFEEYFDVYGTNRLLTMQILTSDIMQMLVEFQKEIKVKFDISLKNNKLFLRFFSGEMFEAPYLKKETLDKDTIYKYYSILKFTFKLQDKVLKILEQTEY